MIMTQEEAYQAMLAHHASLIEEVNFRVQVIRNKVANQEPEGSSVSDLVNYMNSDVVPHAIAEEHTIYLAASDKLGLSKMIGQMVSEHQELIGEISALREALTPSEAVERSEQLALLFSEHVKKENDLILPQLFDSRNVDLTLVLGEMHELFEAAKESADSTSGDSSDTVGLLLSLLLDATKTLAKSGQRDQAAKLTAAAWAAVKAERPELANKTTVSLHRLIGFGNSEQVTLSTTRNADIVRELDVRPLAPAQRHSEIFASFRALAPGRGFMLINDHDPKPLQYQFEAEYKGEFTWDYLECGPKVWRVRIGRAIE